MSDNDVAFLPCVAESKQSSDGANYQAPETYGNPKKEEFDPIVADTWSFGAVIYYMATKKYPYDPTKQSDNLEEEIQGNVKKMSAVTDTGRDLVSNILRTNTGERIPIGFVEKSPWFDVAKKVSAWCIVGVSHNNIVITIFVAQNNGCGSFGRWRGCLQDKSG